MDQGSIFQQQITGDFIVATGCKEEVPLALDSVSGAQISF